MRNPRRQRIRDLTDKELEHALVDELVEWLLAPGRITPGARLEALHGAYRRRFMSCRADCVCEECLEDFTF